MKQPLILSAESRVLVLTGAGASAESGIPTFRDANGLWEQHAVEEVASPGGFRRDPALVWRFYSQRRAGVLGCAPNRTHTALRELETQLEARFLLVTQNVDGLHQRAGSERVIELHGNLMTTRCATCSRPPFADASVYADGVVPFCQRCDARGETGLLRPHIVWFGEMLDPEHLARVDAFIRAARGALHFIAVGTSGAVYPAAALVEQARAVGGTTYLINAEPAANTHCFDHFWEGPSGQVLPEFLARVL